MKYIVYLIVIGALLILGYFYLNRSNKIDLVNSSDIAPRGLQTKPASNITKNSAILNSEIEGQMDGNPCTERYVYFRYGTDQDNLLMVTKKQRVTTINPCDYNNPGNPAVANPSKYSSLILNLIPKTKYYFRAILETEGIRVTEMERFEIPANNIISFRTN